MPNHDMFDRADLAILDALQEDASIANADLAARIGMSASACLSRTKRLRESGVIRRYVALVDEPRVGLGLMAFVFVTLGRHDRDAHEGFLARVEDAPQVMECYHLTGQADYLLRIVARDIAAYRDFLMDTIVPFPDVSNVETRIVLKAEKRGVRLPIAREGGQSE